MSKQGIRWKIQVTFGYLIGLAATSFFLGVAITILVVAAR
jgi:hypothetical protein